MDFFREQDVARRNTRLLTLLFTLAVLVLVALTNVFLALALGFSGSSGLNADLADSLSMLDIRSTLIISACVMTVIGAVVLYNWIRFSQGGRAVVEALGGRPVVSGTQDAYERRAQNIVQEISLAANMPVPPLYVMDDERGINALAAGVSPGDAVVAVTRGAMVQLSRDELQGVIGHEFSHILNGDMRLSIRLAAMLRGITFIGDIGAVLLRSGGRRRVRSSNRKNDTAGLLVIGLGLYLIGLIGGLMAGLIKSAISKQKEYLADASSVQFTRNPDGIGNALKVIGGYTPGTLVHTARAEELSHLFFGQVKHRLWLLFATHPKLEKRILRVDPHWDGRFIERSPDHRALEPKLADEMGLNQARRAISTALPAAMLIDLDSSAQPDEPVEAAPALPELAGRIIEDAREPLGAMSLILGLLWHEGTQKVQLAAVEKANIRGLELLVAQSGRELQDLAPELRLPLIELCLPTLKTLSEPQYKTFKQLLLNFIRADGRVDLFEWCLYQLVRHYLDPQFVRTRHRAQFAKLEQVSTSLAIALGTLAQLGKTDTQAAFQSGAEVLDMPLTLPQPEQLGVQEFGKAVDQLAACYPLLKVTILKALAKVAEQDGEMSSRELTLIKAIAAVIDCPLPNNVLEAAMLSR